MKQPKISKSENQITQTIIQYLELNKWHCYKIFNGSIPAKIIGNKIIYKKKDKKYAGISDLICLKENYPILTLEIKAKGNKPSPEQLKFIDLVRGSQNGWGEVCYSVQDVENLIKELDKHYK